MLAAVKGIVQGNMVIIKDDDIREYDGEEVIVTLLNYPRAVFAHVREMTVNSNNILVIKAQGFRF